MTLLAPMGEQERPVDPASTRRSLTMPKPTTPTVYGPTTPSLLALRGIRLFSDEHGAGGDGATGNTGGDGGNGGGNSGGNGDGDQQSQQQQQSSQQGGQQRTSEQGRGKDGTFSREYVQELRTENQQRRKNEGTLETRATAAEERANAAEAQLAELTRRDAVRGAATEGGGNVDLLLDSASFERATKDVDLTKKADVVAAIKKFVEDNPSYATAPAAGSSGTGGRAGGAHSGGTDHSNNIAGAVGAALART